MPLIQTVLGPIEASQLGRTYMHEHVFVLTPEVQQAYPGEWDEEARVADAVAKLTALADQGVRTIVDPTVLGLGRDLGRIRRINELVPQLNIVAATGCYTYKDVPFYFRFRGPGASPILGIDVPDPLVEFFVRDIEEGSDGVRVGMLKCAIDAPGLTAGVERVMRAVARAHRATGVPITVHTHPGRRTALDVQRVLVEEEGLDPGRVVLGHSGDTTDLHHLTALAEVGFVLGMDRFGVNSMSLHQRADVVVELCRRGYADSMVLSHDAACHVDWLDPRLGELMPDWNYLHLGEAVLPYLRAQGVTDDQITTMLVEVPRRVLAGT